MIQAIINDFQSLSDVRLKIDGVTIIVGETNQGKSACLRALQAACTNRFKAGQVSQGKDRALIKIKVPESEEVLMVARSWSGGSPKIKLGDHVYSKLGRTLPLEVSEFLNLGFLDFNGEQYSCNFHSQFQKPLLLEYSQQKVMELLSASTSLDDLKECKEYVMAERIKNKGAIQAVDSIIEETELKCKELRLKIKDLQPVVEDISVVYEDLNGVTTRLSKLDDLLNYISVLNKDLIYQKTVSDFIEKFEVYDNVINDIILLQELLNNLNKVKEFSHRDAVYNDYISTFDPNKELQFKNVVLLSELQESFVIQCFKMTNLLTVCDRCKEYFSVKESLQDVGNKNYDIRELESKLEFYNVVKCNELELLKVVENNICPICGNKVN